MVFAYSGALYAGAAGLRLIGAPLDRLNNCLAVPFQRMMEAGRARTVLGRGNPCRN